jgi:hypothetical protein
VKLYVDEDSAQHRLIAALRSHALDVLTSLDAGMNARDDESRLAMAVAQGILIVPQQRYSTGEIVHRVLRLAESKFELTNGLFYLSSF